MKEKIIKILEDRLNTFYDDYSRATDITGIYEAAEEIIKEMDKACCEKCRYYSDKFDKCEYHLMEITDSKILKCNDFTEMEGE